MYKISVPIALDSVSDENTERDLKKYLGYFKKGKIERVFICCLSGIYTKESVRNINSEKFKYAIDFFKENGLEVGVWIGGFGHGSALSHDFSSDLRREYQKLTGVMGESYAHGYCPDDENFSADYIKSVKEISALSPDIIMLDDDFRLNIRSYELGCFCPVHLKKYYELIGEEIPRAKIKERIFSGGKNKYRDAYMELMSDTLLNFAKNIRRAVDEVNPKIRVGFCSTASTWDMEGTDVTELAKAFAGEQKPFFRLLGAPYWSFYNDTLIDVIETERMQAHLIKNKASEVEIFAEGDVYPRPRYNVPSKKLELFDLALKCDGALDGDLKYMFSYENKIGYENGYIHKHIKNLEISEKISRLFSDKKVTGVQVYSEEHKFEKAHFPSDTVEFSSVEKPFSETEKSAVRTAEHFAETRSAYLLNKNGISTCFEKSEYPVAVYGENARTLPLELMKNGVILDACAAEILTERGVDAGLLNADDLKKYSGEHYVADDDFIAFSDLRMKKLSIKSEAEVLSLIMPEKSAGAYIYENADGIKFLVFAADFSFSPCNANYFNNYYRQKQLIEGVKRLCGKRLPAVSEKNPDLYVMTAKNDEALSVLCINAFPDEITEPIFTLDKKYSEISFVNCTGELKGDKVYLSELPPYGFAAFEVK